MTHCSPSCFPEENGEERLQQLALDLKSKRHLLLVFNSHFVTSSSFDA